MVSQNFIFVWDLFWFAHEWWALQRIHTPQQCQVVAWNPSEVSQSMCLEVRSSLQWQLFSDAGFWVVEVLTLASAPKTDITDCTLNYSSLMWSLFWQDHGRLLSSSSYRRTYCMHLNSTSFHLFLLNKKKTMSPPDLKVQHLKWSFFISLQPASRFFPLLHFV